MTRAWRLALIGAIALVSSGHVGSPDAWFEGMAGPWRLTVHIEALQVIPGIAVVNVKAADSVDRITAYVNTYDAEGGTPPPDELKAVAGRPGWRSARLWVMNSGSNRVTIDVLGAAGHGSVVVPLAAVAQRRLSLTPVFLALLATGGAVLIAGMLTLVGATVREGTLDPGALPDEYRRRRARVATVRAGVFIALVLAGMTYWWRTEDRAFRARLYRPLSVKARVDTGRGVASFVLTIDDSSWLDRDEIAVLRARGELPEQGLIADHGKLMHLFLAADDGRSMAHLHPATADTISFASVLPALPAGSYRVFADIVHQSGFTQTLTSTVVMPAGLNGAALSDEDDSYAARVNADSMSVRLDDGSVLNWIRPSQEPVRAGEEAGLRFVVERPAGDTIPLQPYLGMPGHVVVVRDDGQVFIHLHPMGTISPAAQARLAGSQHGSAHAQVLGISPADTMSFPYSFPKPGRYTVWVQVKHNGRILTGSINVPVI